MTLKRQTEVSTPATPKPFDAVILIPRSPLAPKFDKSRREEHLTKKSYKEHQNLFRTTLST